MLLILKTNACLCLVTSCRSWNARRQKGSKNWMLWIRKRTTSPGGWRNLCKSIYLPFLFATNQSWIHPNVGLCSKAALALITSEKWSSRLYPRGRSNWYHIVFFVSVWILAHLNKLYSQIWVQWKPPQATTSSTSHSWILPALQLFKQTTRRQPHDDATVAQPPCH